MAAKVAILCVGGEPMHAALRDQLRRDLGDAVRLETARDVASALERLGALIDEGHLVPLVIADQVLPGMDGQSTGALGAAALAIAELVEALEGRGAETGRDEPSTPGPSVGSYSLIERLGAGGMGDVWRARHKHLTRPAAVKLIQGSAVGALDAAAIQRFRREAEATARLRSPHTVELYDFGLTAEGGFFYVMELLAGLDLQQLVERYGPLPPERVVHLLGQALRSLMEAHDEGLVHRDIKPANLFVARLGADYDFVKVLDFGLVTPVYDDEEAISDTGVVGTPAYMSPEHAAQEELDGRADLYSLGAVAFWMLTGERLFPVTNPAALVLAQMSEAPDAPSRRLGTALPEGLDAWVLSLLAKSRADRPSSARDAYRRLGAIEVAAPWTHERAEAWWRDVAGWDVATQPRTRSLKLPPR
ncbi:MAG: protein kinase [Myxococcales bacterium]|nr:protein kinase [Myxococcales bacterium]